MGVFFIRRDRIKEMEKKIVIRGADTGTEERLLYLTDDTAVLKELRDNGRIAAFVSTPENQGADLSGIPYVLERAEELEAEDYRRIYQVLAGLPRDILETDRCRIREVALSDAEALRRLYQENEADRFSEEGSWDLETWKAYIEDYRRWAYGFYGYGIWAVEGKASGRLLGRAGIEEKESGAELGYLIAAPFRRQGYGYEVCSAIVTRAAAEYGCKRLAARTTEGNKASIRLLQKLGFLESGRKDGWLLFER